jgi:hypothetical protein
MLSGGATPNTVGIIYQALDTALGQGHLCILDDQLAVVLSITPLK